MKKLISLPNIQVSPKDIEAIYAEITRALRKYFFAPIMRELKKDPNILENSLEDLISAVKKGKIFFYRGRFRGKFGSKLSKELKEMGSTWDNKTSSWALPASKIPKQLKAAIDAGNDKWDRTVSKIDKLLEKITPEDITDKIKLNDIFMSILGRTEKEIQDSVKGLVVPPKLTKSRLEKIAEEYTWNLKLDIKKFTAEKTADLRGKMKYRVFQGYRYEGMIKQIQSTYGVTAAKAKFWARQETNLLTTTYKYERYAEAGIRKYRWKCVVGSPLHPVRSRHQELNDLSDKGEVFDLDKPPVTSEPGQVQRRNNPGRDYNCRCVALMIIQF